MGGRNDNPNQKRKEEAVKLPVFWKFCIYAPLFWAVFAGWLYVTGIFTSEVVKCDVIVTEFDSWMANSIGFAGALGLFSLFFGLSFLENRK